MIQQELIAKKYNVKEKQEKKRTEK